MEQQQQKLSGLAIASMVCSLVSFIPLGMGPNIILAIIGIVLGVLAKKDITNNNKSGTGLAKTGIICGTISIILYGLLFIIFVMFGSALLAGLYL